MKKIISFLVFILIQISIFAQAKYEGLNIIENVNTTIVEFILPEITLNQVKDTITKQNFYTIKINDDFGIVDEVGKPELPQFTFDFEIPDYIDIPEFEILSSNVSEKIINLKVLPYQEDISTELPYKKLNFDFDVLYYQSAGNYSEIISISEPYIIAGKKGVKITITPINYNPLENKLIITDYIKFSLNCSNTNSNLCNNISFDNFFSNHFINYNKNLSKDTEYGNYLIITAPQYETTINYFAIYKRNLGYNVFVVTTDITGNTTETIKAYLQTLYDNETTRPVFVLLVGDTDEIPNWTGEELNNPDTDLYYATLDGDDMFRDVFLGRFSVRSTFFVSDIEQLQNMINKTIFMETNIQSFYKNAVFPADNDWWGYFTDGHDWVVKKTFEPEGYECLKLYEQDDAVSQDLIDAINLGQLFCLYSGHGSNLGWASPLLHRDNIISDLTNTIFPFGYGFACLTNQFSVNEVFGEAWLRYDNGGVTYVGSSQTTYYRSDEVLEKKIFGDAFTDETQIAPMFYLGLQRYWNAWATIGPFQKKYMEQYNLMGDPSLIYTGIDNSCFANYIFDIPTVFQSGANVTIQAENQIIASENNSGFVAETGSNVTLVAGESIVLKHGFHAEAGSNFHAYIAPCEDKSLNNSTNTVTNTKSSTIDTVSIKYEFQNFVKTYPNPFSQNFTIEYKIETPDIVKIEIFNLNGISVYTQQINNETPGTFEHNINSESFVSGIYFIKVLTNKNIQTLVTLKIN